MRDGFAEAAYESWSKDKGAVEEEGEDNPFGGGASKASPALVACMRKFLSAAAEKDAEGMASAFQAAMEEC